MTRNHQDSSYVSPWPHRLAWALVCATFPLIWVGGLVTTTDAGMAVPDWPTTYGYNMFAYPWQTWLFGPWDQLIEHGHRLLGSLVGLLTIAFVVSVFWVDKRRWMHGVALAALALVIAQGVLGGLRVIQDERHLAMVHGMTGPLFFALSVAMAIWTSPRWVRGSSGANGGEPRSQTPASRDKSVSEIPTYTGRGVAGLAIGTTAVAYLQLVLGALVRHLPAGGWSGGFRQAVMLHLLVAGLLFGLALLLAIRVFGRFREQRSARWKALALMALLVLQLTLGAGTWVVKYNLPAWAAGYGWAAGWTVQADGLLQTHVVTAHVATGSLILVVALALAIQLHHGLPIAARRKITATLAGSQKHSHAPLWQQG